MSAFGSAACEAALKKIASGDMSGIDLIYDRLGRQIYTLALSVLGNEADAEDAMRAAGVEPRIVPTRGGTDGATLSFMGLPCPNLGTGGYAYHGPQEHITLEGMEKARDVALELIRLFAEKR